MRGNPEEPRKHRAVARLTDAEHTAWTAAQEASGRREMGAWVRAVVNEHLSLKVDAPSQDQPVLSVPPINYEIRDLLVRIGNNVNQATRHAHSSGEVDELLATLAEVRAAARAVVLGIQGGDDEHDQQSNEGAVIRPRTKVRLRQGT